MAANIVSGAICAWHEAALGWPFEVVPAVGQVLGGTTLLQLHDDLIRLGSQGCHNIELRRSS